MISPRLCSFLALLCAFSATAFSSTVIDDTFADGNRTGQTPPASIAWYVNTGSTLTTTASVSGLQLNNAASRLVVGYFTAAGSPTSLTTGQTLTLEFFFTSDVAPASVSNGFNLALFNSGGTRLTGDFSGTSNAAFTAYDGYGVKTSGLGSTSGSALTLRQRNATATPSTALMSTSGDWSTLATGSGTTTAGSANTAYVASLVITNNGATVALSYTLKTADGVTTLQSVVGTDSSTLVTTFDTVALYFQTAEFPSGTMTIQRARVTLSGDAPITPPSITTQPVSISVLVGSNVDFTVAAMGGAPLSYQWKKDGANVIGANAATLSLTNLQSGDAGSYTVVVSNSADSVTSTPAILGVDTVAVAPTIVTSPVSQTVNLGGNASFSVAVSGTSPFTYQWQKDGEDIVGATNGTLSLSNVQATDAGSYAVVVSNAAGPVTSNTAALSVITPPSIIVPPASQTVSVGGDVTFGVTATGTAPLSYQWKKNTVAIVGATATTLSLSNVQSTDAASYTVTITNAAGFATSAAAVLTVDPLPSGPIITTQPSSQFATIGGTATFTVVVNGTAPFTYQWHKDGTDIVGATAATLSLTNAQPADIGSYTVTITNSLDSVTSNPATLGVAAGLPNSAYNLAGFAQSTTGGGVIPETDAGYRKVTTPLEFITALADKTGAVKVIEITADLDLGYNEVDAAVRAIGIFRAHATPKLHPRLITTGVSLIDIQEKANLTIFSANGATIRHATLNIKSSNNVILRNLRFDEMWEWDEASKGDYDKNDWDFVDLGNSGVVYDIWIDHCTFTKAYDGVSDIKKGSYNITFSWNKYVGDDGLTNANSFVRQQIAALEANPSAYPMYNFLRTNGFSVEDIVTILQGHDKTHLIGANSLATENAQHSVTFHHQWYMNPWDRLPRLRGGNVHNYNIYVDDELGRAAKALRDARVAAMTDTNAAKLGSSGTYNFNVFLNGSISTEGAAILVEKSFYRDCITPLRNNQTDITNSIYTGKILALDTICRMTDGNGISTTVRGNSTDADNPMGPFQAPAIAFSWNLPGGVLPYTYTMDDPANLPDIMAIGAGAGRLGWAKENWLKTTYVDAAVSPSILTQPVSQTVNAGSAVTFNILAGGATGYQWNKDAAPIAGATNPSLTLTDVQAADAGNYTATLSNSAGSTTSAVATLTVNAVAPTIVTQPTSQSVSVAGSASFTVGASGTKPFSYQWSKNGSEISGATAATLSLANVQDSDSGDYTVVVSNSVNTATSAVATLTVATPPSITTQPLSQTVAAGVEVSFTVDASGTAPLSYQWKKDASAIPGATAATLSLLNVQAGDTGSYTVTVSNAVDSVTSAAAVLTVNAPPKITTQPTSQSVVTGATVTFSVFATGSAPFGYQWKKGADDIAGATNSTLVLNNVQGVDAASYSVVVSNAFGFDASNAVTLTVTAPGAGDLHVAPGGLPANDGTIANPTTLESAITRVPAGATIWVHGGTYSYAVGISVALGNNGADGSKKSIVAYQNEIPVYDFSSQPVADSSRGLTVNGNFWHVRGLIVQHAGDNGIYIGGNDNIVERCITRFNADTGLQLGRASSSFADISQWPSRNLILNCESHDNKDATNENADGFACKLTTGVGNVFRGCIAHNNIDDGWDLFTKTETGPIGPVTIDQCIAYNNGVLSNGSSSGSGDKNGFKLGGTDIPVIHVVSRSIAFGNGKNGFTWNSNPATIRMINNLAFDNAQGNFKFDQAGPLFYNNASLWTTGSGINDRYGGSSGIATGPSNCFWYASGTPKSRNDQGIQISAASFVSLTVPAGGFARHTDGSIDLGDFGRPVNGSPLINAGEVPAALVAELPYGAATYYENAPDIGVVESYLNAPPTITTQPVSQSVTAGASVTFSVAASGTAPFSYQWFKDDAPIAGATNGTLALASTALTDAGSYRANVTNVFGTAPSASASLTVAPATAPSIVTQPASLVVNEGGSAVFTVVAEGSAPLSYQWYFGVSPIAGANAATLSLSNVQPSAAGTYFVKVSNAADTVSSATASLTVNSAPVAPTITAQPLSTSVTEGGSASFTITASGTAPFSYQWYKGGNAIAGATTATLTLNPVQAADAGSYSVNVSDIAGTTPSAAATLTVNPASGVSLLVEKFNDGSRTDLNPPNSAAWFGSSTSAAVFTNGAGGANGMLALDNGSSRTLIGYFTANGSPLAMAAGDTLTLDITLSIDAAAVAKSNGIIIGLLQSAANPAAVSGTGFTAPGARVTGDFGSSNPTSHVFGSYTGYAAWTNLAGGSNPATLRKRIVTASPGTDGLDNASASWTALGSASGTGTAPSINSDFHAVLTLTRTVAGGMNLNYKLRQGVTTLVNYSTSEAVASTSTFDTVNVYMAGATLAGDGAAHLALKQVNVGLVPGAPPTVAPTIATQPVGQTVIVGGNVSFTVTANGTAPFSYQWRKGGSAIGGATSPTLALSNVQAGDAGDYDVVVTNSVSSATSAIASLTVNVPPAITQQPVGTTITAFADVAFAVEATGTAPLTYQWFKDGAELPGATSATLALTSVLTSAAGSYRVTVTNIAGSAPSDVAVLVVNKASAGVVLGNLSHTYDGSAKSVTATTLPSGLTVNFTYDGSAAAPVNAGSYAVSAIVSDPNYAGSATGTLVIAKALATIDLAPLTQRYDGTPRPVVATTTPAGIAVDLAYDGAATVPIYPGLHSVVATINTANYTGTKTDSLIITVTALVRHAPTLGSIVDGSVQVLLPENESLKGAAALSGDLLLPGTPVLKLNGSPTFVGMVDGFGSATPANYTLTLGGGAVLRYIVRHVDAIDLPVVATPPAPAATATRNVTLTSSGQSAGDFATLRNLTLKSGAGIVAVPAGTYGAFVASGGTGFVFGVAGATQPAIYNLQSLTLSGSSTLQVVGPVILTLANGTTINGAAGNAAHPEWLTLNVSSGGVALDKASTVRGVVNAPTGTVMLNDGATLEGRVAADRLTLNTNALLDEAP